MNKKCNNCGKEFVPFKSSKGLYCGHKCSGEAKRGIPRTKGIREKISKARLARKRRLGYLNSPETRKKISDDHKGKIPWNKGKKSCHTAWNKGNNTQLNTGRTHFKKGQDPWNKGKTGIYSKESLEKMSNTVKGKNIKGDRHPQWQGGISFEPYGIEFNEKLRAQIRGRDNYRCQECFRHQDELYYKNGNKYSLLVHHIDYDKKNNDESNLISLCNSCHSQTNFSREDWTNYFKAALT